jgi:hypothetical protein
VASSQASRQLTRGCPPEAEPGVAGVERSERRKQKTKQKTNRKRDRYVFSTSRRLSLVVQELEIQFQALA